VKGWQFIPERGAVVDDSSVQEVAESLNLGRSPLTIRLNDGRTMVAYSRTRLYLDRDAWERLPEDGILLLRIRPHGLEPFVLAMTRPELEATFGEVRQTRAWEGLGCYHFPNLPPAVRAFRVGQSAQCTSSQSPCLFHSSRDEQMAAPCRDDVVAPIH
jgi:hypothetical protein